MVDKQRVKIEESPRFQDSKVIENKTYENLAIEAYFHGMCGYLAFRNVTFKNCDFVERPHAASFFDCVNFEGCTFENCHFKETQIRWSYFKKCKFIGCTGSFGWFYGVRFYKSCTYEATHINILNPTSYVGYFNLYKGVRQAPAFIGE